MAVLVLLMGCRTEGESIFDHVEKLCNKDNGRLWGVNLYSPVLGVDSLRNIVSNVSDAPESYPADKPVANSTIELDGRRWTTILWPLSGDVKHQSIVEFATGLSAGYDSGASETLLTIFLSESTPRTGE